MARSFYLIFFLVYSAHLLSQNINFDLKSVHTSRYFYNSVNFENEIYFGTNEGIFKLIDGKFNFHTKSIVGPIAIRNGKLVEGTVTVSRQFKDLLPVKYRNIPNNVLVSKDNLYIISNGKLFVYEKNSFNIKILGSVRAISENYIGTYDGVRRKGDSEEILPYTNSYIREFDNATFICWDGLYVINDSINKNYFSETYGEVLIKDNLLGRAKDIIELKHPHYIFTSDKGIYNVNIIEESVSLISNEFSDANFFWNGIPVDYRDGKSWFFNKNKIFNIDLNTFDISPLFEFQEEIKSVYVRGNQEIYVLLESKLLLLDQTSDSQEVVMENLRLLNDVGVFENFVFITSDLGVHLYDRDSKTFQKNIINDEFNKKAFFIGKDSLLLGGVNGLYSFDYISISNLFLKKRYQSVSADNSFLLITKKYKWQILAGLVLLLMITNLIFYFKYKTAQKLKYVVSEELKSKIEAFIDENISSVNIEALKSEFNLSNNQLYSYMGNVNPGEIIRKKRLALVKKLRRANESEEVISKKTGFSVSYLKKI